MKDSSLETGKDCILLTGAETSITEIGVMKEKVMGTGIDIGGTTEITNSIVPTGIDSLFTIDTPGTWTLTVAGKGPTTQGSVIVTGVPTITTTPTTVNTGTASAGDMVILTGMIFTAAGSGTRVETSG